MVWGVVMRLSRGVKVSGWRYCVVWVLRVIVLIMMRMGRN